MSEYLSEEEQVARLKSWWQENGTSTMITVVVAAAAVFGWRWYGDYSDTRMQQGSDVYAKYLQEGDEASATAIATEFEGTTYHVLVMFDKAKKAVEEGDLVQAAALLQNALEESPSSLLSDLARIRLAQVQEGLDRGDDALQMLAQIKNPSYRALALEVQGDIHSARGDVKAAYESYEAAIAGLAEGDDRPLLKMKRDNAAPYAGVFVEPEDSLGDALEAAQETLGQAGQTPATTGDGAESEIGTQTDEPSPSGQSPAQPSSQSAAGASDGTP